MNANKMKVIATKNVPQAAQEECKATENAKMHAITKIAGKITETVSKNVPPDAQIIGSETTSVTSLA